MKQVIAKWWPAASSKTWTAIFCALGLVVGARPAGAGINVWTSHGPPVDGPGVQALVIDPLAPTTLYAGTNRGVFKSVDGGDTWVAMNEGLTCPSVSFIAMDPGTTTTLYVGGGCGVYQSTDGGGSWGILIDDGFYLAIDTTTPGTLYATQDCQGYRCDSAGPLIKSTDGGSTWATLVGEFYGIFLAIAPTTPTTLYTWGAGVRKSTDGGHTWGLTGLNEANILVNTLAIDPDTPTTLYVAGAADRGVGGVHKSTDGGETWMASATGLDESSAYFSLAIDPTTPTTVYVGATGAVYKSTDAGRTWSTLSDGLPVRDVVALAIDAENPRKLYAAALDAGVFAVEQSSGCTGDCDANGEVEIHELVSLVNIGLDRVALTACTAGDDNRDGSISVDEIMRAVNAALRGCAAGLEEATVVQLQAAMGAGRISALDLVEQYLGRIDALDRSGPALRSVVEINPDARSIAAALDVERAAEGARGPLHGIPVLLKDNIDTGDRMSTTAGSLALLGAPASRDATVAERLRDAGAVLLGKTNLSEWANMRSLRAASGWSARGGQTLNPYALDRSPCGSSSGSAVAVAANLSAVALGTETDGSIVCPAAATSIVGLKPTVGLTSRAGVIPLAHSLDTVGVLARTVADAAAVLGVLAGADPRDPATEASAGQIPVNYGGQSHYTQFLDPDGLRGARIGVPRQVFFGRSPANDAVLEAAIDVLRSAGAVIVDPADLPSAAEFAGDPSGFSVLLYEFKADLNAYLATRSGLAVATLGDLILFNEANADTELALFGQEIFTLANAVGSLETPAYLDALARIRRLSRDEGLDAVMTEHALDALVASTAPPPWLIDYDTGDPSWPFFPLVSVAARAGYPVITVPAGFADDLPLGVCFVGRAFSEPTLIRLAYAFEQTTHARRVPPPHSR